MKNAKMFKGPLRGWLPKDPSIIFAHKQSKSRWKRLVWMVTILLTIILLVITSTLFAVSGVFLGHSDPQDLTSFGFHKVTNMTTPKIGDVFEITVNASWFCPTTLEFERRVELIDPYPESNCQLISGNNVVQCSGYNGGALITYLLEVIDDNLETFMLSDPFTAVYLDGVELQFRTKTDN